VSLIPRGDALALTRALVAVDSRNPSLAPDGPGESAVAELLARVLREWGFAVDLLEALPGRPNLLARIGEALYGRMVISDSLNGLLAHALRDEAQTDARRQAPLTQRERTILTCLANGLSNKLIARELDIAEGTVKVHIKNLLKKLKFRSRLEAAVWAIDEGIRD